MNDETVHLDLTYHEAVVLRRGLEFMQACFEGLIDMDDAGEMLPFVSAAMKLDVGLFTVTENRDENF